MPAITATHMVATPPPYLAPPEPWDGALSPAPHRRGDWARGLGPPFRSAGGETTQRHLGQMDGNGRLRGGGRRLRVCVREDDLCSGSPNCTSHAPHPRLVSCPAAPGGRWRGWSRLTDEETAHGGTYSSPGACDKQRVELGFELWPATLERSFSSLGTSKLAQRAGGMRTERGQRALLVGQSAPARKCLGDPG